MGPPSNHKVFLYNHVLPQSHMAESKPAPNRPLLTVIVTLLIVTLVILAFMAGLAWGGMVATTTTTTICYQCSPTNGDAFVQGFVQVNGLIYNCPMNVSCVHRGIIDFSVYSLVFSMTSACPPDWGICPMYLLAPVIVQLTAAGGYSVYLPQGQYNVTLPNCPWDNCSQTFPTAIVVYSGQYYTYNFTISSGVFYPAQDVHP